jgi:hypothetical protein
MSQPEWGLLHQENANCYEKRDKSERVKLVGPKGSVLMWLSPQSIEPLTHGFLLLSPDRII